MSLQDPEAKMSKSDKNLNNIIAILDSKEVIKKKIKLAVTDSGVDIKVDKSRPGISNLVQLYSLISDMSIKDVETKFDGKMYSDFKVALGDLMVECLDPMQKIYAEIINDNAYLESVLSNGAENAYYKARKTLSKVYRKIGFIPKK